MIRKSLIVTFDFPPVRGGISSFMLNIAQSLPPEKITVLTQTAADSPKYQFQVIRKKIISSSFLVWPRWLPLFWSMLSLVFKEKVNLIQVGQILPFGTCALIIKKFFKIPYIVFVYGNDLIIMRQSFRKTRLIRSVLKNAESVIGCSYYSKQLAESKGANPDRTHVIYPCPTIKPKGENNQSEIESFKSSKNLNGKKILLTVGNLVLRKGHDQVIRSLPQVIRHYRDFVYIIAGNGPQLNNLKNEVARRQLDHYVQFWPHLNNHELRDLYHASDIFIMPSRYIKNNLGQPIDVEGFGIVFIEAGLYGKPVIGGNTGGVPEAIKNGYSGITVDPENVEEISAAITKLFADNSLANRLGEQGRKRALDKFDWLKESNKLKLIING